MRILIVVVTVKGKCPAFGKMCSRCGKWNHCAKVCQATSKSECPKEANIHQVEENASDSEASIYRLQDTRAKTQFFSELKMQVPGEGMKTVRFQLDTGASCSTLTLTDYNKLTDKPGTSELFN